MVEALFQNALYGCLDMQCVVTDAIDNIRQISQLAAEKEPRILHLVLQPTASALVLGARTLCGRRWHSATIRWQLLASGDRGRVLCFKKSTLIPMHPTLAKYTFFFINNSNSHSNTFYSLSSFSNQATSQISKSMPWHANIKNPFGIQK